MAAGEEAGRVLERLLADGVVEVQTADPELRDAARRSGWSGELRGPLRHDGGALPATVAEVVAALVPRARVTPAAKGRGLQALVRRAVAGMPDTAEVVVDDGSGLPTFRLRHPDRPDVLVEELARVVDTTVAWRVRFGRAAGHVRLLAVDRGPHQFRRGRYLGVAEATLGTVHVNATSFLPGRPTQLAGIGVHTPADLTTAHELWHQVELAFAARDYRASVAFRRQVGAYFGVETIEQAAGRPGPARDRLAAEVSAYGATSPVEATAELAEQWWCGVDTPVVRHFADVVDRFFPPPA